MDNKIGKTLPGLMSLDFCCDTQMVGSEFGIKNMKAWIHPALSALLCLQYGPKSLRNVSNTLLNLCLSSEVLKAKGVQPGTSKLYLIKWPVSICIYIYIYIYTVYIYIYIYIYINIRSTKLI